MKKPLIALLTSNMESLVTMKVKEVERLNQILANEYGINKSQLKNAGKVVKVRTGPKVGRNEFCPCGSNLKYKKCCL